MDQQLFREAESRFQQQLRSVGMKSTRQRLLVLRSFLSTNQPVSASELHYAVKREDRVTSFTTIYRTLKAMVACGLAREVAGPNESTLYEHDHSQCAHRHLVCKDCGAVIEKDA